VKKIFAGAFFAFLFFSFSYGEVPNSIRYNGRLKSYQVPVNGTKSMNFKLYGAASGGTALWESGNQNIAVSSGIFTCDLTPQGVDWRGKDIWLELVIENKVLAPREKIMSQIYAFHSDSAENLSADSEIEITVGGKTRVVYISSSNNFYHKPDKISSEKQYLGNPPGTVIAFAGPTSKAPAGYLLCDGRTVSNALYPDLFEAIGNTYGNYSGDDFALPDFRGMFLRGAGEQTVNISSKGNNPSQNKTNVTISANPIGEVQGDAIRNITGSFSTSINGTEAIQFVNAAGSFNAQAMAGGATRKINSVEKLNNQGVMAFNSANSVPVDIENRPVNYAVNYYIKY